MHKKVKIREEKILSVVEKNRKKDIQIFEQSKLVSISEWLAILHISGDSV